MKAKSGKNTILIVEDEEKISRLLKNELEYEGYKVAKAGDGTEALNYTVQNLNQVLFKI